MQKGYKSVMLALGYYSEALVQGVADFARAHRWHLVFQNGGDFQRDLKNWRGDGIISSLYEDILLCRDWSNTAIVSFIEFQDFPFPYRKIREDDKKIGQIAAEYFMNHGYKNYAAYSCSKRYQSYRETLEDHNFHCIPFFKNKNHTLDRNQEKLASWLKRLPKPCAVFCENDWDAVDAVSAAIWNNIKVPSELAILGGGNMQIVCNAPLIPISSIDFRYYELGHLAAEEMEKILNGIPVDPEPLLLPPSPLVVERKSTDYFAVENPKLLDIISYIRKTAAQPVSIQNIAKKFALSYSAFYKLCVRNLGISPKQLQQETRLAKVREMLLSTQNTMEEIASTSGFPDPCAMFSAFRKKFKISPAVWRRENKTGGIP